ncbi:MAG: nuclear transport factor 2 family protein [Caulobacteraceae bacterium]
MTRMTMAALAAVLAAAGAAQAQPAALSPTDIVHRHMAFAAKGDVDSIVGDYADDAVVLTAGKAAQGKAAIRAQFAGMFGARPAGAPAGGPPAMKTLKVWQEGDVGFVSWQMGAGGPAPINGVDEFLVRGGKIQVQAVFTGLPKPIE